MQCNKFTVFEILDIWHVFNESDTIKDTFNCSFVIFRFESIHCNSFGIVIKKVKKTKMLA
jgi:hypothetical protein